LWRLHGARRLLSAFMALTFSVQSPKCRWLKAIARGFMALLIALCLAPLLQDGRSAAP
jgi:hypothetical protein